MVKSDYLSDFFVKERRDKILNDAEKTLIELDFGIIACRGVSGILWGTALALRMDKDLLVIRKKSESSHSFYDVEGYMPDAGDNWIIVDDFIGSGNTVNAILHRVKEGKFLGALLCQCDRNFRGIKNFATVKELAGKFGIVHPISIGG